MTMDDGRRCEVSFSFDTPSEKLGKDEADMHVMRVLSNRPTPGRVLLRSFPFPQETLSSEAEESRFAYTGTLVTWNVVSPKSPCQG